MQVQSSCLLSPEYLVKLPRKKHSLMLNALIEEWLLFFVNWLFCYFLSILVKEWLLFLVKSHSRTAMDPYFLFQKSSSLQLSSAE